MINVRNFTKNLWLLQFILFATVLAIYGQTWNHEANLDDEIVRYRGSGSFLWTEMYQVITSPYFNASPEVAYGYRPVTSLSFYLEATLLDNSDSTSHLINLLLYLSIVILLFQAGLRLIRNPALAFAVALIFAVHPLHSEVVSSIKNRDELLALLFALLAFLSLFLSSRWPRWMILMACIAASLLSKKTGLGLFLVAPALIYIFHHSDGKTFWGLTAGIALLLLLLAPVADFSSSLFLTSGYVVGMFSLFRWAHSYRFQFSNKNLYLECLATISMLVPLYAVCHSFSLAPGTFTIVILTLAYLYRNHSWLIFALVVHVLALSVLTNAWYVLPFAALLFWVEASQNYRFKIAVLLVMSAAISLHLFTSGKAWAIFFSILYTLPLLNRKLFNRYVAMVAIGSLIVALLVNVINATNPTYLLLLLGFLVVYILRITNRFSAKHLAFCLVTVALSQYVDPVTSSQEQLLQATQNIEPAVGTISQSGRELDFIENPLAEGATLGERTLAAANTYGHYIAKLFYPHPLSIYYGFDTIDLFHLPTALLWSLICIAVFVWLFLKHRSGHTLVYLLLFFISLAPFANLLMPVAGIVGDRLAFLPSVFFVLAIATAFWQATPEKYSKAGVIFFIVLTIVLSYRSFVRSSLWVNKETLYTHDAALWPGSVKLNHLTGDLYFQKAQTQNQNHELLKTAFDYYQKGAETYSPYYLNWFKMGLIQQQLGNYSQALDHYRKVQDSPYVDQTIHFNMAICATLTGQLDEAEAYYYRAINQASTRLQAYLNLAYLYLKTDQLQKALSTNEQALLYFPEHPSLNENHARIYFNLGDTGQTIFYLRKAIELGNDSQQNIEFLQMLTE